MSSIGITIGEILLKIRHIEREERHLMSLKLGIQQELLDGTALELDKLEIKNQEEYLATLMNEVII